MLETKQRLTLLDRQSELQRIDKSKALLTKQELQTMPEDTTTYHSIGRLYVLSHIK